MGKTKICPKCGRLHRLPTVHCSHCLLENIRFHKDKKVENNQNNQNNGTQKESSSSEEKRQKAH